MKQLFGPTEDWPCQWSDHVVAEIPVVRRTYFRVEQLSCSRWDHSGRCSEHNFAVHLQLPVEPLGYESISYSEVYHSSPGPDNQLIRLQIKNIINFCSHKTISYPSNNIDNVPLWTQEVERFRHNNICLRMIDTETPVERAVAIEVCCGMNTLIEDKAACQVSNNCLLACIFEKIVNTSMFILYTYC